MKTMADVKYDGLNDGWDTTVKTVVSDTTAHQSIEVYVGGTKGHVSSAGQRTTSMKFIHHIASVILTMIIIIAAGFLLQSCCHDNNNIFICCEM